jgi:hypothetical protein
MGRSVRVWNTSSAKHITHRIVAGVEVRTATAGIESVLLVFTAQDAYEVMLLPRRVLRQFRFVSVFYRVSWAGCQR